MNSGNTNTIINKSIQLVDADIQVPQWKEPVPKTFTASQRATTTVLFCGFTATQDLFIQAAFTGIGYNIEALDVPDNNALQTGREFGNRGQCNPTYYMVGNVVKHLQALHASGLSKEDIIKNYLFVNVGSCGPCRFGTYVTEYRKALRDSGFEGFRIILFDQTNGVKQASGEKPGFEFGVKFFSSMASAVLAGDVLNTLSYRIRPYEIEKGATDKAIVQCKKLLTGALEKNRGFIKALRQSHHILSAIEVDKSQVKPKVSIIGEFWAMTTEGDGNYQLQRFLEGEGAEVEVQPVTAWIQYLLWGARYDTIERSKLRGTDKNGKEGSRFGLEGVNVAKRLFIIKAAEKTIPFAHNMISKVIGLKNYKLTDMDTVANVSHKYYSNHLRGGEGHMEVGKLILNVTKKKVNMTVSVKPFGCMPSSGVSDGVQSIITEHYPDAIFAAIETTGDGAVNVYSRLQMQLFKARQVVENGMKQALSSAGLTKEQYQEKLNSHKCANKALNHSKHHVGCTAINTFYEVTGQTPEKV